MLGRDLTGHGLNRFSEIGCTLFTIRNGMSDQPEVAVSYCEKLLHPSACAGNGLNAKGRLRAFPFFRQFEPPACAGGSKFGEIRGMNAYFLLSR